MSTQRLVAQTELIIFLRQALWSNAGWSYNHSFVLHSHSPMIVLLFNCEV